LRLIKKAEIMARLKAICSMIKLARFSIRILVVLGLAGLFMNPSSTRAADSSLNSDTLPMFGQPKVTRPDNLKSADEAFIRDNTLRYNTRQAASVAFAAQGWSSLKSQQLDTAMLRFNQAWLLNGKNYAAFWGFGAVLSARGRLLDAIEQLEAARELIDEPAQRPALLCDLATLHSEYAASLPAERQLERAQRFVGANNRFTESLENDPTFATAWREWAMSLYEQERYGEAWAKVKRARELRAEVLPPEFLKKLSAKMAEPK
jgi:tetratricopeptide (TPR) repeat protein